MDTISSLFWFRQDLRLSDNPALVEACHSGKVLPIYIFDDSNPSPFKIGSASKVYLHYSLSSLNKSLTDHLNFYTGNSETIILKLVQEWNIKNVFWNRCYEPWQLLRDDIIQKKLERLGVNSAVFNSSYLWDPESVLKKDRSYYQVFGAYKRTADFFEPRKPLPKPKNAVFITDLKNKTTLNDFNLIPNKTWYKKMISEWDIGELASHQKLSHFVAQDLDGYKTRRDYPGEEHTSKLSPHLHFGEISPNQVWAAVNAARSSHIKREDIQHFLSEIMWREFSCYLLYHFPALPQDNFHKKFDHFPWKHNKAFLKAWQTGNTGYPLIDAGMRQLWQTGYMHNRVRMVVASFLVKNLMIHWHHGRDWFWDCLVDADLANNSASWQWVAGSGVDAAPYFRIFNPTTQGEQYDADGSYTRKYVPELKDLPNKYLFKPWEAPQEILAAAGLVLGKNYPKPLIDLKNSREAALLAYQKIK